MTVPAVEIYSDAVPLRTQTKSVFNVNMGDMFTYMSVVAVSMNTSITQWNAEYDQFNTDYTQFQVDFASLGDFTQDAEDAAAAASGFASAASGYASTASGHSSTASGFASTASGHADTASTQAAASAASAALAADWAALLGAPVASGEYSAKHWAQQASGLSGIPAFTGALKILRTNAANNAGEWVDEGAHIVGATAVTPALLDSFGISDQSDGGLFKEVLLSALQTLMMTNSTLVGSQTASIYTNAAVGASFTVEPDNGIIQDLTLNATSTFTDGMADGQYVILHINDGSARTINWFTITWIDGDLPPDLDLTLDTVIVLWKVATIVYGKLVGIGG